MWNPLIYKKALLFAAQAHKGQRVPGNFRVDGPQAATEALETAPLLVLEEIPYVTHLVMVANHVLLAYHQQPTFDIDLALQCALLHDILEDTATPANQVEAHFGAAVLAGVEALTKNSGIEKARQMPDSLERILAQPQEVAIVKMCDRTENLDKPPHYWKTEKRQAYLAEAQQIYQKLSPAHGAAAANLLQRIDAYRGYLQ